MREQLENITLSTEQQEQKEKFVDLSDKMLELKGSHFFDSIAADEAKDLIKELALKLRKDGPKLDDYLLNRLLSNSDNKVYDPNIPFDKDGEIEKLILDLCEKQQKKDKLYIKKLPK